MNNTPQLKEVVKNNTVTFSHYHLGFLHYTVSVNGTVYTFPVSIADIGGSTLSSTEKAMAMRYHIRRAIKNKRFVIHSGNE